MESNDEAEESIFTNKSHKNEEEKWKIKQVMSLDEVSTCSELTPSNQFSYTYKSCSGNQIELLDRIGTEEESIENMIEYHGNPEDMDMFMNCNIDFTFPLDEIDREREKENDRRFYERLLKGASDDDESTNENTIEEIDIFSKKVIPEKKHLKKIKQIPDIF
jgi:hypothetical protein